MSVAPDDRDVLVVRMNHCNAGFFAQVQFAINQIRYAEDRDLIPVVYFGEDSIDGPNAYFDSDAGPNVWEYYFEPVGGLTLDAARNMAARHGRSLFTLKYEELWRIHRDERRSVFTYPYGYYHDVKDKSKSYDEAWWADQRTLGRRLVREYVHIKPEITAKVDRFVGERFRERMIGVHVRGTDKHDTGTGWQLARVVPPAEYFPFIDDFLDAEPDAGIFFATDQMQFRDEMADRYGERVVWYASTLSTSAVNAFQMQRPGGRGNRDKGEEVLVDALLLSRCDKLLKCTSAVGEFALYFSDPMEAIDLNFVDMQANRSRPPIVAARWAQRMLRALHIRTRDAVNERRSARLEAADHPSVPRHIQDTNRFVTW